MTASRHPAPGRLRRALLGAALGGLAAAGVSAQPGVTSPPLPAAPRELAIAPPTESRLPNGLRVIVAERPGVQLVTAQLLVLSGSETDPRDRAGLSSLTAGLLTQGTRRRSASAMASAAEALGGSLDSGGGWNRAGLSITVSVPKIDAALGLVAEAALQPTFAQAELDRLRAQALDGLKVAYSQPGALASFAAARLVFGTGPYGHPAGGTPASLPRIARADLVALHAAVYRPDNAVLVLAGDIDASTAEALARKHFGAWRAPSTPLAAPSAAGAGGGLATRVALIDMPQSGQAGVTVVVPVPPRGADRAAADVMNAVLGGGYSARLNQEVRVKRGLSYGARSQFDARLQGGLLAASAQTKNESAAEVVGLIEAEFDRLSAAPVPADELRARKATLIGGFSRSVETTAGLEAVVASLVVAGLPTAELGRRIAELEAVTPADVQAYAAANLGAAGRRVVVAGEADRFEAALKQMAPGAVRLPATALDLEAAGGLTRAAP